MEGRMAARASGWVSERTPVLLACAFRWTAMLFHTEKKNKTETVFSFERMGKVRSLMVDMCGRGLFEVCRR